MALRGTTFAWSCRMTNFFVYMIGVLLVVAALAYGASLMGISSTWIAVFALAVLGLGVMGAIVKTKQKEPS
jgi:VIT1/CCC1 family predicted Fe2+/Mn2+ transporter